MDYLSFQLLTGSNTSTAYNPNSIIAENSQWYIYSAIALLVSVLLVTSFLPADLGKLPVANYDPSHWTYLSAKWKFIWNAKEVIAEGFRKFGGPFTAITDHGPMIVLPPSYIDAVNQEPNLSFIKWTEVELLTQYETFQNLRAPPPGIFDEAILKGLTRALPKFSKPLSDEMTGSLDDTWGVEKKWHDVSLRDDVQMWVGRLSTRIFNGDVLCKNPEWLRITISYTTEVFTALAIMRTVPAPLRWITERLLPGARRSRSYHRRCQKILAPIIKSREVEIQQAAREGRKPNLPNDSIEWFRNAARGRPYQDAHLHIGLSIAAIHTTSDLLSQAMMNLCVHPEMVQPIREEAVRVLSKHGWTKIALTELRVLDSFLKETQRLKPVTITTMHRIATKDVELPNNVVIKKGQTMAVSSHRMWSEEDYTEPHKFDGLRYVERRKLPGHENTSHLISTSHDHTGFSHGKHSCPGRFFAANEVKIAMVHIVMKYDMDLVDNKDAEWLAFSTNLLANPKARMRVRRRQEEINLDTLEVES